MVSTLLVALGLTEDADAAREGGGALSLPLGVLLGGGLIVLAGTILESVHPGPALALTAFGCGASIAAALWTVVVPVLLITFFVLRAWQLPAAATSSALRTPRTPRHPRVAAGRPAAG